MSDQRGPTEGDWDAEQHRQQRRSGGLLNCPTVLAGMAVLLFGAGRLAAIVLNREVP